MSISALILGESGTGKSTSLRNLDPAQTLLIQAIRKPLPFRSSDWKPVKEGGNIIVTDQAADIIKAMRKTTRQVIVIDDWQYILANEYMRRTDETGYQKFTDIGRKAWDILSAASDLDAGKRVYILAHTQSDEHGRTHIKTIGKMLDETTETLPGYSPVVVAPAPQPEPGQLERQAAAAAAAGAASAASPPAQAGAPVIQVLGNNPAVLQIGVSYVDLGATITGPTDADRNLGIHYMVDGIPVTATPCA